MRLLNILRGLMYDWVLTTSSGEAQYWLGFMKPREEEAPLASVKLKALIDAEYYTKDVKWAREQEFLKLKQGKMIIVVECVAKFSELSCFTLAHVDTSKIRMDPLNII